MVRDEQVSSPLESLIDHNLDGIDREQDPADRLRRITAHQPHGVPRRGERRRVQTLHDRHDVGERRIRHSSEVSCRA